LRCGEKRRYIYRGVLVGVREGGDERAKVCKTQQPLRAEKKLTTATIKAAIIVSNKKAIDVYHNM